MGPVAELSRKGASRITNRAIPMFASLAYSLASKPRLQRGNIERQELLYNSNKPADKSQYV